MAIRFIRIDATRIKQIPVQGGVEYRFQSPSVAGSRVRGDRDVIGQPHKVFIRPAT